jgi:hypothetical protein
MTETAHVDEPQAAVPANDTPPNPTEMRARAQQCGREIEMILQRHRCTIQPFLRQDPVGQDGARMMVQASFVVAPLQ